MVKKKFASAAMQTKHIFFFSLKARGGGYKVDLAWHLDSVHLIWTKFGMDIPLDPRNNPVEAFFIFLKIQDGRHLSKIEFRHNIGLKITFLLGK